MPSAIVRGGRDVRVASAKPSKNFRKAKRLRVNGSTKRAFIFLKSPAVSGETVTEGTLRLVQTTALTGSVTVSVRRVSASWKAKRINWNNQPGVTGQTVSLTKASPAAGTVWEFDVSRHLQSVANGSPHYGWRVHTSYTTADVIFASLDANRAGRRPRLEITYSTAPAAPSTLIPNAGVVSVAKPVLQFDYTDNSGSTELAAVQVQIDAAQDGDDPDFDSGEVAADAPVLDLSETAFTGVADGASTYWRVRVKDGDGLWSEWSDWATLAREDKGTLTISAPTDGGTVTEYTPPVIWSLTGETQTHYRVRVYDVDASTWVYDSGKTASTETSHTIPETWRGNRVLRDDRGYRVVVDIWDSQNREATAGDPTYTRATADFTVAYSSEVDAPATLSATQNGTSPWIDLEWTRASAPDSWTIERDGEAIAVDIDPADVLDSGTTYAWRDWTARPGVVHTYRVRSEVNGVLSDEGPTDTVTAEVTGVWIGDPENETDVVLSGDDIETAVYGEDATIYNPLGATGPIRVVQGMRGLEGSLRVDLRDQPEGEWDELEAALFEIKSRPAAVYRLAFGTTNIPAWLGEISPVDAMDSRPGAIHKRVTIRYWQSAELPYTPEL